MKLNALPRTAARKSDAKKVRRSAAIPAVLYAPKRPSELIAIAKDEMKAHLRKMRSGLLPTTVFTLAHARKEKRVVIKEIQYSLINYEVSHVDFQELVDGEKVRIKVPIQCTGVAECKGVKEGGILRQVIRTIPVECLPKDMPKEFSIDVRDLAIMQVKRLSDIAMPPGVRPLARLEEVVVVVGKK